MREYTVFGVRLKAIRKELGLSQQNFADMCHTTKQNISRYETLCRIPTVANVQHFATKAGVTVSYFMGETSLSPQSYRLAIAFDASSPEVQESIWNMLRAQNKVAPNID